MRWCRSAISSTTKLLPGILHGIYLTLKVGRHSSKGNTKNKLMNQYSSDVSDVVGKLTIENKSISIISQNTRLFFQM